MKTLIVDDEKHVRNAIRHLVNWEDYGIDQLLEAENGEEAMAILRNERPELVITDMMMPVSTGIELMEWMMVHAPDTEKIVISGYNDFEYVRQTVKHGGVDYLLKPIDQKHLREAVGKAIGRLNALNQERQQQQRRNIEVNELKPIYRDKLLSGLLSELETNPKLAIREQLLREFPALHNARLCRVALLDLEMLDLNVRSNYASNLELLTFTLINICHDIIRPGVDGFAFSNWHNRQQIVLLLWTEQMDQTADLVEQIREGITATLKTVIAVGLGCVSLLPAGLYESYTQASIALRQRNLLRTPAGVYEYRDSAAVRLGTLRFGEHQEEIRLAVKSGQTEQIRRAVHRWMDILRNAAHLSREQLDAWQDEYSVAKTRWAEEEAQMPEESSRGVTVALPIPLDDEGNLSLTLLEQEICLDLNGLAELLGFTANRSNNTIYEIARYIKLNYSQNIKLQDIAGRFHLNKEYISRKFSQELQETLIDYLNRVRVEQAKLLLQNPQLTIAEIAMTVGYQDEKYFSRVFKKQEGRSPREYRRQAST